MWNVSANIDAATEGKYRPQRSADQAMPYLLEEDALKQPKVRVASAYSPVIVYMVPDLAASVRAGADYDTGGSIGIYIRAWFTRYS
jgi:hypothetical protein